MEETLEQKKRRLLGKKLLNDYLKELEALTNIEIKEDLLLSIPDTDSIGKISKEHMYKSTISFNEKEKLLLYIGELINIKDGNCFLYITYSRDCGALKLSSLKDFNTNFKFYDEHAGILSIVMADLTNELLLDYYEEDGEHYLEIEAFGEEWSKVKIE